MKGVTFFLADVALVVLLVVAVLLAAVGFYGGMKMGEAILGPGKSACACQEASS